MYVEKTHWQMILVTGRERSAIGETHSYTKQLIEDAKYIAVVVIFLDNASIYHDKDIEALILNSGNRILFNTPYTSPLNPIKYIFGFWK